MDISECLHACVQGRNLSHFILGNLMLPDEIRVHPNVLTAGDYNLFHDLVTDPAAHAQAMSQYTDLDQRLKEIINNEQ
ncbi:hypothetical protein HGM15179_022267 [Zosterops borbonicus]|uniref:Uncharacterized protein n=1 Tax=Zosterops borbonicus TaxID=364589 RepID=A0A8K1FWL1_9PASS|nr:hypothetical protein HGM15179_022267 [Zosterops borbonicus]